MSVKLPVSLARGRLQRTWMISPRCLHSQVNKGPGLSSTPPDYCMCYQVLMVRREMLTMAWPDMCGTSTPTPGLTSPRPGKNSTPVSASWRWPPPRTTSLRPPRSRSLGSPRPPTRSHWEGRLMSPVSPRTRSPRSCSWERSPRWISPWLPARTRSPGDSHWPDCSAPR